MSDYSTAAFFRAEGALVDRGALAVSAYFASNGKGFRERALRLGALALAAPVMGVVGQSDRNLANRAAYLACRRMGEDRVMELAEEYWEDVLSRRVLDRGRELVQDARRAGHRIVVVSEAIEPVIVPLAEDLRADELVCNRLEFIEGEATGKLLEPVVGGHEGGRWVKEYAERNRIDLSRSLAYGAHGPDLLMLAAVGNPCAVNPDFTLRGAARDADWPVVEYRA